MYKRDLKTVSQDFLLLIIILFVFSTTNAQDKWAMADEIVANLDPVTFPDVTYNIKDFGAIGIILKSVGHSFDSRSDYPYAAYNEFFKVGISTEQTGDVYARFHIRIKEVYSSIEIIQAVLNKLPREDAIISNIATNFKKKSIAISIVEGWRGEIIYFVTTDLEGNISRVFPHDPSITNWPIISDAVLNNIVPDFPLINKSFNLSYSGNDL